MTTEWLLGWWNLIFIVPFLLALIYIGLYASTGLTFGEVDADADVDVDADVDMDADVDVDADVEADLAGGSIDLEMDTGLDGDHHVPVYMAVLSWIGVGRVPLSIVLMLLLLSWGVIGFLSNVILISRAEGTAWADLVESGRIALLSLPAAILGSMLATRYGVLAIARWLPLHETSARRRHALLGSVGEALYDIDDKFGMVCGRDDRGGWYQVSCRTESGQTIAKGQHVKLVGFNAQENMFLVTHHQESATESAS